MVFEQLNIERKNEGVVVESLDTIEHRRSEIFDIIRYKVCIPHVYDSISN